MIEQIHRIKSNIRPCKSPFWANSGHLQTILSHLIPSKKIYFKLTPIHLKLDDGDEIVIKVNEGLSDKIIYLFHGLGGSIDSNYIQRTAIIAHEKKHTVILVNHRGCGDGSGLAKNPYHSGRYKDLEAVIKFGKTKYPDKNHIAIGFSLSANALLLLSSKNDVIYKPNLSIAVNAPINLLNAANLLEKGLNRIYDKRFLLDLKKYIKINRPEKLAEFKNIKSLKDFDNKFTAPLGGFQNREDYYFKCSSSSHLKNINVPTIIITAKDDPFVDIRDYLAQILPDNVILHVENNGGHIGYLNKRGIFYDRWLDYCLNQYINY